MVFLLLGADGLGWSNVLPRKALVEVDRRSQGRQANNVARAFGNYSAWGSGRASPHEANHRKIVESSEARASSSLSTPTSSTIRQLRGDRSSCLTHPHQKSVSAPSSAPSTLSIALCVLRACLACGPASLQRARAPYLAHRLPPL